MLKEISNTAQRPGELKRRWFHSPEQDLYLWENEIGEIVEFQLCYSKFRNERALFWKAGSGFTHYRVDDGEAAGRVKHTPILSLDGPFSIEAILTQFSALATAMPKDITDFVRERIRESSGARNAI